MVKVEVELFGDDYERLLEIARNRGFKEEGAEHIGMAIHYVLQVGDMYADKLYSGSVIE